MPRTDPPPRFHGRGGLPGLSPRPSAIRSPEWKGDVIAERPVITIVLIDDNRLVREGISSLLSQVPGLKVVAASSVGDMSVLRQVKPQVVLLDLGLRNGDSVNVAARVKKELPDCRIILMDLLPINEEIMTFVDAGVSGFILKDATLEELASTIRSVAEGANVLPAQMTRTLFSEIARRAVRSGPSKPLEAVRMTPREREVINLIAEGLGNKEIATRLHIATHTVKSHVRNIMEKLMLHTRLQIAAYAHQDESL